MPTSLGPAEILVILVVALIVLGPKRLPEAGRQVGKALSEIRRWTTDVTREIKDAVDVEVPPKSTVKETRAAPGSPAAVETRPDPVPVTEVTAVEAVPQADGAPSPAPPEVPPEVPPGDPARL